MRKYFVLNNETFELLDNNYPTELMDDLKILENGQERKVNVKEIVTVLQKEGSNASILQYIYLKDKNE